MPLLIVLIVLAVAWYGLVYSAPERDDVPDTSGDWDRANLTGTAVDRMLLRAAQPLAGHPSIYDRSMSPQYRSVQSRLLASGGLYGGSVEVFLAVQVAAVVVAAIVLSLALTVDGDVLQRGVLALFGLVIGLWPNQQLTKAAKTRTAEINASLPAFADLLQMPLSAGMGVLPAMSFTVDRVRDGVVKDEIENMLRLQKSRAVTDAQAFMMAGERMGTAEAKAFFTALMQAHTQGMRVAANLEKQAEALREKAYEQRREQVMRLPTKISVAIAMHFMPTVLIVTMLPVVLSLTSM